MECVLKRMNSNKMDGPMKESACERINLHLKKWSTILHRIFKEQTFERMEVWRNKPFASHLTCQFATIVATQMETSRFKVCDLCGLGQAWRTRILHVKNFSACCQLFHSIGQGVAQVAEYWATNQKVPNSNPSGRSGSSYLRSSKIIKVIPILF